MGALRIFPIGACQLAAPLKPLERSRRVVPTNLTAGIANFSCYTLAEAIQRIRFARGELTIPKHLYRYCALPDDIDPNSPRLRLLEDADLVLLEVSSSICTVFESYALNRATLLESFVNVLGELSQFAKMAANDWFLRGLMGCNESRLRQAADYLVPLLPGRVRDVDTVRELLRGMRGIRQDFDQFVASIAAIKDMMRAPVALVASIYQYLPDGRPVSWPPDHLENTLEAARRLGLPIFNPMDVVLPYGVDSAMDGQRLLYREEFGPVIAEPLFAFCCQAAGRALPADQDPRLSIGSVGNLTAAGG